LVEEEKGYVNIIIQGGDSYINLKRFKNLILKKYLKGGIL